MPNAFRHMFVERLNPCENIVELAKEPGTSVDECCIPGARSSSQERAAKNRPRRRGRTRSRTKSADSSGCWSKRSWQWIFLKGALHNVEARRQRSARGFLTNVRREGRSEPMKPDLGIADTDREDVVKLLPGILADEFVLYTKTRTIGNQRLSHRTDGSFLK